ncbi:NAD(P)-dependent oxidoreductase [Martelella soudanensis]|uniref:NAD(P)-dependent oxidoreductase n=1 Tax=unclassified Martelella TaxID=2629616 RepID=UPI0015E01D3B|nr:MULTISPECIES: NAD(P)-dependent oxidoreductase [unclassified Martelella]
MDIAFVGLGIMGQGMVRNLLRAGHDVTVWNRSLFDLPADLAGANRAPNIAAAIAGKSLVMVCVTGPDAQRAIYFGDDGLIAHLDSGAIVADATTTDPAVSLEIAAAIEARGGSYLDTPVFGSKGEAWDGRLDFVCGGAKEAFDRSLPVLEPLAASVHHLGASGNGAAMKLVGNLLVAAQMESLGEALSLAIKSGLDGDAVMGVFDVTDYSSLLIRNVGRATLGNDFAPSFFLRHMLKDTRLVRDFARLKEVPVPITAAISELYTAALNKGLGDLNASALHKMQFEMAGVSTS